MNNIPEGKPFNLEDIFASLPTETEVMVDLPSKGRFYQSNKITLRPMTFEDEKAMVMAKKDKVDIINTILHRCVHGVHVQDLLLMDKLFLLLKLREISYGDNYSSIANCGKCSHENTLNFKLSDLPINYIEDNVQDLREITLPISKAKLVVRIPRVSDEKYLQDELKVFDNIWRFIVSIQSIEDPVLISKFIKDPRLPLKDIHALSNAISLTDYGIQTKVRFDCDSCDFVNIISLPLGADFFTVS
jgi:hypothetical protein